MGIYVNPGNAAFGEAVNSAIYVDKEEYMCQPSSLFWKVHGSRYAGGLL